MADAAAPAAPSRVGALDGLRGWAALGVLMFHLTWELFGVRYPLFRTPVALLFTGGGGLAICTFFTTSGYLLTIRRWRVADDKRLAVQLVKRYVRLTVPILASALIFWAVLALHLSFTRQAAAIVDRRDWLGAFGRVQPDLIAAFTFALWRNYFVAKTQNYGPFLWTMAIQLWGSLIVLPVAYGQKLLREPYTALLLGIAVFLYVYPLLACFPLGAMIALLQRDGVLFRAPPSRTEGILATLLFFLVIVVAALTEDLRNSAIQAGLSTLFIAAAIRATPLAGPLTGAVSRFLGRVSFPLYLVQCAVLVSLTSWLIVVADGAGQLNLWTALGIVAATVAVTLLVSWAFLPIETLAVWLTRQIDRPFGGRPAATA